MLYQNYSGYLKEKYNATAYRVAIDAGFSCPNRIKGRQSEGCAFCDEAGSRATYQRNSNGSYPESENFKSDEKTGFPPAYSKAAVESQINRAITFLKKRYHAQYFLLYFQAFSGTHAEPTILKRIYDHALEQAHFNELIISTRPDTINQEKAKLLGSYRRDDFDVWCELGLQTTSNRLLEKMNRGHRFEDFQQAFNLLREEGINIAVHLISGYPGETKEERDTTLKWMQELQPEAVKIHNINVVKGTPLYRQWAKSPFKVATMEEHIEELLYYIRRLPKETILMRLTCDTERTRLIQPENKWNKSELIQKLSNQMKALNLRQGDLLN